MKTSRKQLVNFAIGLVKEVCFANKNINVEYRDYSINLWFHYINDKCENIRFDMHDDLKINKDKFKKAILKIRGIIK